ncbi:MAG: DUF1501 domain-containing protein [Gemmataceae bacterium]
MLRVLGSPQRLCDGWTRREMLRAGGLGYLGLSLADYFRLQEAQAASAKTRSDRSFGKAKSCILLFLYGSPSQLETFDTKPTAPPEIRGELGTIRSSLPGCDVGELLPHTAKVMHKVTTLRSLTHPYPIHGVAYATTGVPAIDVAMELSPRDPRHWPFVGSVVDFLDQQARRTRPVPGNIALPFPMSTRRVGEVHRAGPYAAFLGSAYNPVWTNFRGKATGKMTKTLAAQTLDVDEPYIAIDPHCQFPISSNDHDSGGIALNRLDARRSLLEQMDRARRDLSDSDAGRSFDRNRARAMDLIHSSRVQTALDVEREPSSLRDTYGMSLFGQSCLVARRLVEAGSRFVTVFWDEYGLAGSAWDTHWDHYDRMKKELCPGFDRGFSGLINDLDARGMLDDTLVVCISEHGRTPKLTRASRGMGRDHWSRAYSAVLAGGGIARGRVIGRTDKIASDVTERPISPKDILATTYHLLGIDIETTIDNRFAQPLHLVPGGHVLTDALV